MSDSTTWSWLGDVDSETSRLLRRTDWSKTSVGPVETWPPALKLVVAMLLHASYPMFLWWGPDLVQFYNDGYVPSFGEGRHPSAMGARGQECWSEIWPIIGPQINSVLSNRRPLQFDDALVPITRNGRVEDVFWTYTYTPVFDTNGAVAGVLVIVTETTARVLAERRRVLVRDVVLLVERATSASDMLTNFGSAIEASDFLWSIARDVHAATADGSTYRSANAPDTYDAQSAIVIPLLQDSGEQRGELIVGVSPSRPIDGALTEHAAIIGRLLGNGLSRLDSTAARLSAENERTNLLLQAPVAAALLVGSELTFEIANRRYVELVGREVVGRRWRDAFPELVSGPVEQLVFGAFQTGTLYRAKEQVVPLLSPSGDVIEERFFDFNLIPIRNGADVDSLLVVAVELTQQIRARRELERVAIEREHLLAEVEAANKTKDDFLAMLGHELRNPLAPILTAVQLLDAPDPKVAARARTSIARQASHLTRLVDDLLDIARLTRGLVELRKGPVEVGALMQNALALADELIVNRQHRVRIEVDHGLTWNGDGVRLTQVIANLLTNAARYTETGGLIVLHAHADSENLVVSVKDNGKGIEPNLLEEIFNAFVQGRRTLDRRDGGLGLGLALSKNLVELHGGTIRVKSDGIGRGSEFIVVVPGVTMLPAPTPNAERTSRGEAEARRILIVDDNVDAADLLGDLLTMSGHDVVIANDGAQAKVQFALTNPEIAILDIGLPDVDGYRLAEELRGVLHHRCRFYALTGFAQASDIARAREAGFAGHLSKPVDLAKLRALINSATSGER